MVRSNEITKYKYIIIVFIVLFDVKATAQPVIPEHVIIEFDAKSKTNLPPNKTTAVLRSACRNLGKSLLIGAGPWGIGAFRNFSCNHGGKKVSGKQKKTDWKLIVSNDSKEFKLVLKNDAEILAETKFNGNETWFEILQDPEFSDLVAYSLMVQFPFFIKIDKNKINSNENTVKFRYWQTSDTKEFKFKFPPHPDKLIYYTLQKDPMTGAYKSNVVGEGAFVKKEEPKLVEKKSKKSKQKDKKPQEKVLKGGFVYYSLPKEISSLANASNLWAHNIEGPVERDNEVQKILETSSRELDRYARDGNLANFLKGQTGLIATLLESTASGYVGMRYGLQVLPVEGQLGKLLDDTSIFNLVAEVRGGPVKGLRYYYDKLPETKMKLDSSTGEKVQSSLAFARHVLGYSWEFPLDFIINRITIDPKLGVWTFNARLPISQDELGRVLEMQDFNLGSTASVAIEGGAEISKGWFTLRGFYAFDGGFSLVSQGAKVTSNRFGGDAFFKAGPEFKMFGMNFKTAVLGSFVYEAVTITRGVGEVEAGKSEITGISYSAGYAGGGGAISW